MKKNCTNPDCASKTCTSETSGKSDAGAKSPINANCLKGARKYASFAPAYAEYSENVLFGNLWQRPGLTPKERSFITIATLIACGNFKQLYFHLGLAQENGASQTELIELITQVCFYAGWPRADSALEVAQQFFANQQ